MVTCIKRINIYHAYIYSTRYIYRENPPFNSVMWGSLMLGPNAYKHTYIHAQVSLGTYYQGFIQDFWLGGGRNM